MQAHVQQYELNTTSHHTRNFHLYRFCSQLPADVVYIGVIHPFHLKTCLLFTNAKKNVLCEKPLAMNSREVQEILAAAKKNNVFLMEVETFPSAKTCRGGGYSPTLTYTLRPLSGRVDPILPGLG